MQYQVKFWLCLLNNLARNFSGCQETGLALLLSRGITLSLWDEAQVGVIEDRRGQVRAAQVEGHSRIYPQQR